MARAINPARPIFILLCIVFPSIIFLCIVRPLLWFNSYGELADNFLSSSRTGRWLGNRRGSKSARVIQCADPSQEFFNSPLACTANTEILQGTSAALE